MRSGIQTLSGVALTALALLWPLGVYQYLPGTRLYAAQLLAAVLVLTAVADAAMNRRIRVPFEVAWPATLAVLVAVGAGGNAAAAAGLTLTFLAVVHWTRSRQHGRRLLVLSAAASLLTGLLSVVTAVLPGQLLYPTAYRLHPDGGSLAGPFTTEGGVWTLAFGAIVLAGFALTPVCRNPRARTGLALAGAVAAGLLVWKLALLGPELPPAQAPPLTLLSPSVLLASWLVARVAAKALVLESDTGERVGAVLVALLGFSAFLFLITPMRPALAHAVVLALMVAAARRPESDAVRSPGWPAIAPVGLVLLLINGLHVFPENHRDPRNYAAAAARDLQRGAFDRLRARMERFDRLHANERATHRWLAEAAWRQGYERHAMDQLTAAVAPLPAGYRTLLPPPDDAALEPLLQEMRDRVSAEPPAHLAWERLLAAQGKPDSALQFLAVRWVQPTGVPAGLPRDALAAAVATLLDAPEMTESLGRLSSERLYAVLQMTGAQLETAPAGVPTEALPVVAAVTTRADGVRVSVWSPTGETRLSLAARVDPEAAGGISWRRDAGEGGRDSWRCVGGRGEDLLAELVLSPEGPDFLAPAETGAVLPDATAVLLLTAPQPGAAGR